MHNHVCLSTGSLHSRFSFHKATKAVEYCTSYVQILLKRGARIISVSQPAPGESVTVLQYQNQPTITVKMILAGASVKARPVAATSTKPAAPSVPTTAVYTDN